MLIGSYAGNVSDARRVAVPKKFLNELGEHPIIAKWYENCLIVVSAEFWNVILQRLTGETKVASLMVRDIERFILGSAYELSPDGQGRVVIPDLLTEYSGIKKDAVFVGLGDRVEIWPKETWDDISKNLAKVTKEYIEELAKNADS